ncbi:MAG: AAA family ATPase, partial [Acidobacteria bacterium]|nr:AAA family ATPase [Acidobacteriota bacterium]
AVEAEQARREAQTAETDLAEARSLLTRGEIEPAASRLRSALASNLLSPSSKTEAQRLLDRAQALLTTSVAAEQRSRQVADALAEARRLETAGRPAAALEKLEVVFALASADTDEPALADARALRERLLAARQATEQDQLLSDALTRAAAELAAGRFEEALAAANRALALDRGNPRALDVVRRAYAEISARVLGGATEENLPPAIRFADLREEVDGERVEVTQDPRFRLTGVVIDASAVTVSLADDDGRPVAVETSSQALGGTVITEFRAARRLAPGSTVLTLAATDTGGLTSRSEYRVRYDRPWSRSPWPALSAAGLSALVLGLVLVERWRRRRNRLRRRFNPFIAGGPVFDEELFFGREPLVQRILQTVHNNSLLLHGERRIGKTSLLHQVERRLLALDDPEYDFLPVYIDLQGTPEALFFATLADQIHETLGPRLADPDRTPAHDRAGYTHHDLVRELGRWLKTLGAGSRKQVKLVLLIDEVDELNHYDPRVNQSLRSLFMKRFAEHLAAVVAGVGIRREWEKEGSPWYNFFEEIHVDAIPEAEALRLVQEPIRGTFRVEPEAARRIVEASAGKPFLIQRRCLALVQRLHETRRRTATLADVEAVLGTDVGEVPEP